MPTIQELQPLLGEAREDLSAEYKNWLDLRTVEHKATLAKHVMGLANHGGGFLVLGFEDNDHELLSVERPAAVAEVSQDAVNSAVQRYADPPFHCEVYNVPHPATGRIHPVLVVPGNATVPIMSRRACEGIIVLHRVYIRKPGPKTEEPFTAEEWRSLFRRCLLAGREDMLEAIRGIVSGQLDVVDLPPDTRETLHSFVEAGRARWKELVQAVGRDAHQSFPLGYYEIGLSLVGAEPASGIADLQQRLQNAQNRRLTGWSTFVAMNRPEWTPYPHRNFVEAWVGRPVAEDRNFNDPAHSDFWRASLDGKLYLIRGYNEDSQQDRIRPGVGIDVTLPVWRVGEAVLFAARLAETFEGVEGIAVECRYTGLNNRYLTSVDRRRDMFNDRVSRTDEVVLFGQASLDQIRDNLTEFMLQLLTPLYESFRFFTPSVELVQTELDRLRSGNF